MLNENGRPMIILVPPILSSLVKEAPVCYVNMSRSDSSVMTGTRTETELPETEFLGLGISN